MNGRTKTRLQHGIPRLLITLALLFPTLLLTAGDWPTYLHDPQRTANSPDETILSPTNAAQITRLWAFKTGGVVASSPTVAGGTVYAGSWDGYEYALDAVTGALKWKTFLGTTTAPTCQPPAAGVTSAATVQNGVVYVGGGDSYWYALNAATGAVLWKLYTGDNSATGGHYNWSSPLMYNGYAYIGVASEGDCPLVQGQLLQVNVGTQKVVNTFNVVPSGHVGGGIWTSPSLDPASKTIYVASGTQNNTSDILAQAILAFDASTLTLKGSWMLPLSQAVPDSDWGNTPLLFNDAAGDQLLAAINKNGYLYTFNRTNLGSGPLWQRQIAFGGACPICGDGSVSSAAFANRLLYVAGGVTSINGQSYKGGVRALNPATGNVVWEHGAPGSVIAALSAANGLLLDGAGPTFEVLNAQTGARLYDYTTGGTIYGAPSISNGRIYAGSTDGNIYAFGLPSASSTPTPTPSPDPNCPAAWLCQDVGGATPPGSEAITGTAWSVSAGGSGLKGNADRFRLVAQGVSGDTQVSAQLVAQQAPTGAQAGVIIRQSTDPGAPYYALLASPGSGLAVQYRSAPGSWITTAARPSGGTLPLYLRIQRVGDTFVASTSSDGVTYTLLPGSTATVPMFGPVLAGLATTSGANGTTGTATFNAVTVGTPGPPPATPTPTGPCPTNWNCGDIGAPALVGSQSLSGGTWSVQGAGADIFDSADQFHYVWQSLSGDSTASAHVIAQTATNAWAKAGVMLRGSTDPSAAYYAALVTPAHGITVQYRVNQGANAIGNLIVAGAVPTYLEVARSGNTFTTYTSGDGVNWTPLAGSGITFSMGSTILAGLAVTSHNTAALSTVGFDTVNVTPGAPTPPNVCPTSWTCADIGNPTLAGGQSLNGSTWTIQGSGADIWNASDQFHYVWQTLASDGSVSARVITQTPTDPWAKTGVMLRASTDPAAPFYAAYVTSGNGINVQYRPSQGANVVQLVGLAGTVPAYLEIARAGGVFTAYTSANGVTWTPVAGTSIAVSLGATMLAGMAVTAHNGNAMSTAALDSVSVVPAAPPTATSTPPATSTPTATSTPAATATSVPTLAPTATATPLSTSTATPTPTSTATPTATALPGGCPTGWNCADLGTPALPGSQSLSGGTWTVQGGGADIWNTADQFHYAWQPLAGDGSISARVISQTATDPWAKAGVMLRASTDPGAPFYAIYLSPSNGVNVQYRSAQGGYANQLVGISGVAPAYLQVARAGNTFTAYTSSDGVTWSAVNGSSITLGNLTGAALRGLAVTAHNPNALSTGTFDTVTIT